MTDVIQQSLRGASPRVGRGRLRRLLARLRDWTTPLGRGRRRAIRNGADLYQPATVTWSDRHPALFALVAARLMSEAQPRLLSFGCSTGEEAFTLARRLPNATVDAIDANPGCIAAAQRSAARHASGRVRFLCADGPGAFDVAPYDAVFCLSVLRHGDLDAWQPARCDALLPFARFEAAVAALDRCVRPGGLLVLWGCNFRFADTCTAAHYRPLASPQVPAQPGPFYGPGDRLLPDRRYGDFVFVKIAD